MPEIPECLHRRYRALDDLVNELSTLPGQGIQGEFGNSLSHQPGIKLMCDFWNILKEDPNCDLSKAVKQRMAVEMPSSGSTFSRQRVTCYMAGRANGRDSDITSGCKKKDPINKIKDICCNSPTSNKSGSFDFTSRDKLPDIPLTKALCSLKEAASLDKKCNVRITELMETQKELKSQIQNLEQNERDGVTLLKEADCLWSCMEEEYKTKITESINRHKELMKQLKEVEKSNAKWRRNKKELDDQLKLVCKCRQELTEKSTRKKNDLQIVEMEITDFSKRVATNKRLLEGAKQNQANKKSASDKRIARITTETNKLKNTLDDMQKYKGNKENDGQNFIKEAREDLQKICKILLQKKIENEDLAAEKEALLQEIDLLKQTCDQCKDKCQTKRESLQEAIKRMEKDIGDYRNQCIRCHQCTDTSDARTLCSDCPRCKEQRECKTAGDYCERDATYDCVCISVKEKFLNNVFENMYTVLERQSKTKPGKALADSIVKCLKNSRNGKLNAETKTQVQTFVLNTVKKNLNLTIIGGAVKTRCEMDQDTYKQLMLCLKQVKEEKPPKEDKGTVAKKESCKRWGGATECNCPGGPKYCACIMRAPPPPKEPSTCPPEKPNPPPGTVVLCPHKEAVGCGPVCAMGGASPSPAEGVKKFTDCATDCPFQKNMRAAQCVLGPDSMYSLPKTYMSSSPHVPEDSGLTETVKCKWCGVAANSCVCRRDAKHMKAGCCNIGTSVAQDHNRINDSYHNFPSKQTNTMCNEITIKHLQHNKPMNKSISKQAEALAESICNADNLFKQNIAKSKEKECDMNDSDINFKIIQSQSPYTTFSASGKFPIEVKEKFTDLLDGKSSKDPQTFTSFIGKTDSDHPFHLYSNNNKYQLLDEKNNSKQIKIQKNLRAQDSVILIGKKILNESYISATNQNNVQSKQLLNIIKSELLQNYYEHKTTLIKLKTNTGHCKIMLATVTKTLSGNIAVDITKWRKDLEIENKESNVTLTRSDSGALVVQKENDLANAVVRKTASGSFLLVMTDPVFKSRKTVKTISHAEHFYKITIESDEYYTAEPPAVLKTTPSHNYLVVPDKEYEIQYKETVGNLLEDSTEYYVNLKTTNSRNCVLQIDNSWAENEPNALVVKTDSGEVKVLTRRNAMVSVDSGRKRSSMTNSSKVLGEIMDKLSKNIDPRKMSISSNRSIIPKKSSSDSNIYEKLKLFNSDHKDFLAEPSAVLKVSHSGQYAVILDKESKINFIKNLRSYLKNNFQGLVPVKKTKSGEITIALNGENREKADFDSLKITPSGNLYVIVDKKQVNNKTTDELSLYTSSENSIITDVTSKHTIKKLQHPVDKSVTTSCNGMPGKDCNKPKCVCANLEFKEVDWILSPHRNDKMINFFESQVCGIDWNKVTSKPDGSCNLSDGKSSKNGGEASENYTPSTKALPHIIIKPCTYKPLGKIPNDNNSNNQQCFYVIEAVCPFSESMSKWSDGQVHNDVQNNSNWDSLAYLPPQLPDFLKDIKYK